MMRILFIGIDMAAAAVFLIPLSACINPWLLKRRSHMGKMVYLLFALYLAAVFSVTGIPRFGSAMVIDLSVNLVPLVDILNSPPDYIRNSVLNILLFVPAGIFLPLLWKEFQTWKKTAAFGFGMSLGIEILQIFTFRLTDVDDLIMNTLGCAAGFFISRRLFFAVDGKAFLGDGKCRAELPVLIGAVLFVCVTVQPWLADCFWSIL